MSYKQTKSTEKYLKILSFLDKSGPSHIHDIAEGIRTTTYSISNALRLLQDRGQAKVDHKKLIKSSEDLKTFKHGNSMREMNMYTITVVGKDYLNHFTVSA